MNGTQQFFTNRQTEVVKISELPKINVFGVENVNFSLSLSHCDDYACANVIIY